ncbi:N-acetylmuramoyl-L-alanine amidase [Roseomonas mucosa]|uniref:N-acetylmuramoyl-L-alanine amidase family protein n=1 Tax=Roseomonas TaxID=125216 RepID=UPI000C19C9A8|nr:MULTISPECIES: N-acetylmuramoyl-L-alanine amidase [Roseomonas]ATR21171.1 cell wall hydrolase [Roseomonas sp. FDAARGOS_362]MDT8354669.1 N-acetylmuramoyl-L-alanine amidase [Roseomonas mucosa]UZO96501.1 N-acetylmuramoyl-L-alanine amidase [Roseomonas mucosa]
MDGQTGRRGFLRFGLSMLAMGLGGASIAGPALAQAVALRADGNGARLTLPLGPTERWRLTATARPARLRLHLPGGWKGPNRLAGAGPVRGGRWDARSGSLLLDLEGPVAAPGVDRQGGSLTLTVRPGSSAGFARLARSRTVAEGGPAVARRSLPVVVLDPGHGGKDPGTIGVSGTYEKRVVLATAHELRKRLEAKGLCRVVMTRSNDTFIPLAGRVEFARKRNAVLFMSMHADSAPGARGASVYTLSDRATDALSAGLAKRENAADAAAGLHLPPVSPEVARILMSLVRQETRQGSDQMAQFVVGSLRGDVPLLPNTHRQAAFAVLKAPDIPSVLVEMGFLSNASDEAALNRPAHRAKLASALADAVHRFIANRTA